MLYVRGKAREMIPLFPHSTFENMNRWTAPHTFIASDAHCTADAIRCHSHRSKHGHGNVRPFLWRFAPRFSPSAMHSSFTPHAQQM